MTYADVAEKAERLMVEYKKYLKECARRKCFADEEIIKIWVRKLEELNSEFPATKEFLEKHGLINIGQLSDKGYEELIKHIRQAHKLSGRTG